MTLTSSQFHGLLEKIGALGCFALAIGWEHFMLLVKYVLFCTVSNLPRHVQNKINKKKYDQERKTYKALRDKKRRSGSTSNVHLEESRAILEPLPHIRESSIETYS